MTTLNLTVCPHCGRADFPLRSLERVEAYAQIAVDGDMATGFSAKWDGQTEFDWDSSTTLAYLCEACGATLPEDYAVLLDTLLANTREPAP